MFFSCASDSDCLNHGKCNTLLGTCSCYSGYGNSNSGYDCALMPSSTCSSSYNNINISSNTSSISPIMSVDISNSILSINLRTSLEITPFIDPWNSSPSVRNTSIDSFSLETTISFGNSTGCNYPPSPSSSLWTKKAATSSCEDQYQFTMPLEQVKTSCGFSFNSFTKMWEQDVIFTRYYSVAQSQSIQSESSTQRIRIRFPSSVNDIAVQSMALASYDTQVMDTPRSNFGSKDTVFLGADIIASDQISANKSLISVCLVLNPKSGINNCVPVDFILLETSKTIDPAFSVDLSKVSLPINDDEAHLYGIRAVIGLAWNDPISSSRKEQAVSTVTYIQVTRDNSTSIAEANEVDGSNTNDQHKSKIIIISSATVGGVVMIAIVVVLSILYRRRQKVREAERAFNFSIL